MLNATPSSLGIQRLLRRYRFDPELMLAFENSYWWELDLDELMNLNNFDPMLIFEPARKINFPDRKLEGFCPRFNKR